MPLIVSFALAFAAALILFGCAPAPECRHLDSYKVSWGSTTLHGPAVHERTVAKCYSTTPVAQGAEP